MKSPKNYSQEQWKLISSLPYLTGLLLSFSLYDDIKNSGDKLQSSIYAIALARFKYADNPVINKIVPQGEELIDVVDKVRKEQQDFLTKNQFYNEKSLEEFQKSTLNKYKTVIYYLLLTETTLVFLQYINWILFIAESVIVTSIQNTDIKNNPFNPKERELFNKIKKSFVTTIFT